MHGNVWEGCQDWYAPSYPGGIVVDPQGPGTGSYHVIRGGDWAILAKACRSASRGNYAPYDRTAYIGFRAVLAPGQP